MPVRVPILLCVLCVIAIFSGTAAPGAAAKTPPQIFVDSKGIAIAGYDVVSYFQQGEPRKGHEKWHAEHKGAKFYFASPANRDLFASAPEKFIPQFGGYCAFSMGKGMVMKCDPRRFSVRDGRLYLFASDNVHNAWKADEANLIAKAIAVWRDLFAN